jgi:hypothetical protein
MKIDVAFLLNYDAMLCRRVQILPSTKTSQYSEQQTVGLTHQIARCYNSENCKMNYVATHTSSSWEANSRISFGKLIFIRMFTRAPSPFVLILIEMKRDHILKFYFVEIYINIIFKFTTVSTDLFLQVFEPKFGMIILYRSFNLLTTKFNALL